MDLRLVFSEDTGSRLSTTQLHGFGGQVGVWTGTGTTRSLSFTLDASNTSRLARVGVGQGQLQDEAGNTNAQEKWLYLSVQGSSGAVLYPVTREINVRAGRQVRLDLSDPSQDLTQGVWRVRLDGLSPDASLSHGVRNGVNGSWLVNASDLSALMLNTSTSTLGGHDDVKVTYQKQSNGVWQDVSQSEISVNVKTWLAITVEQEVQDFNNFSRVQQAWNLGLNGLTGKGVSADVEVAWIDLSRDDFVEGNVMAGSTTGVGYQHGRDVGWRLAGAWDSSFVGVAYGATIGWEVFRTSDIDNNSWGFGAGVFGGLSNPEADTAIVQGRGGLGRIVVMGAGNDGGTANNSFRKVQKEAAYLTVVSLDNASGVVTGFSAAGESTLGGVTGSGGTSFAAPHLSGMVALMLEMAPGLGFRDVQNILAYGANYLPSATPYSGFSLNKARTLNGVGLHFSHAAGFGSLDAYNATRMARDWLRGGFTAETITGWTHRGSLDASSYTVSATANVVTRVKIQSGFNVRMDSVQIDATYTDVSFDKLVFNLISPSGTVSPIAIGEMRDGGSRTNESTSAISKRFMGEQSLGEWTLEFSHSATTASDAIIKNLRLVVYGEDAELSQRHVYTDQRRLTWVNLASAAERERMMWLDDRDGGQDVVMASALTSAIEVHLGRKGWLSYDGLTSGFTPGTRVENAFGGDGSDVLVGLADGASLLLGNQGSDVLMGYGSASQLEGGDDDDWLWAGGNTTAQGGDGSDRFIVYGGKSLFSTAASIAARLTDFDPNKDVLLSYNKQGVFEVARFDWKGDISSWLMVQDPGYLKQLQAQWQKSAAPDVVKVVVTGSNVTLDVGLPVLHEAASYADWTLNGQSPTAASLTGANLSLSYASAPAAGQILDLSKAEVYSPLGRGWAFKSLYLGDATGNALNASNETQAVVLYGAGGNDTLTGGSGADVLLVSAGGTSRVTGGTGADVFRFEGLVTQGGLSTVTDFSIQQGDTLDLDALLSNLGSGVDFLSALSLSASGSDAVLSFDLDGQAQTVSASDFSIHLVGLAPNGALPEYLLARLLQGGNASAYVTA